MRSVLFDVAIQIAMFQKTRTHAMNSCNYFFFLESISCFDML